MRPTVEEQLVGIRALLADVVAPQITDPYSADVVAGALTTLDLLVEARAEVVPFLRWDAAATVDVLARAGVEAPSPPLDALDEAGLADHHDAVRALLEASVPLIRQDPDADRAFVELMRERGARYPFVAYRGGPGAHTAR